MGATAAEGLKADIANVIKDSIVLNGELTEQMVNAGKNQISGDKKEVFENFCSNKRRNSGSNQKVSKEADFTNGSTTSQENLQEIKKLLES